MKVTITASHLSTLIEDITVEAQKRAKQTGIPFMGVPQDSLQSELNRKIGTNDWSVKKENPIKFTKADINAVASGRFYRKSGLKILMLWAVVVLFLLQVMTWMPNLTIGVYYGACIAVTVGFVAVYGKKQSIARRELWRGIEGDGVESEEK